MAAEIGILVVGLGKIGWMHAANVAYRIPRVRLAAVCETDPTVLRRGIAEFGVPGSATLPDLVGRDDVDAVLVASPAQTHAAVIEDPGREVVAHLPPARRRLRLDAGVAVQLGEEVADV